MFVSVHTLWEGLAFAVRGCPLLRTPTPELRTLPCGIALDERAGHHLDLLFDPAGEDGFRRSLDNDAWHQ